MVEPIKIQSLFYIVRNFSECYSCSAIIPVIAIAAEKIIFINDTNNKNLTGFTIFYMPSFLDKEITEILRNKFEYYRPFFSNTVKMEYWANHCIYCGKGQGDFYLHAEPGAAFFPTEVTEFRSIELIPIQLNSDIFIEADYSKEKYSEQIMKHARIIPLNKI